MQSLFGQSGTNHYGAYSSNVKNLEERIKANSTSLNSLKNNIDFQNILILLRSGDTTDIGIVEFLTGNASLEACASGQEEAIDRLAKHNSDFLQVKNGLAGHYLSEKTANMLSTILKGGIFESTAKTLDKIRTLMRKIENEDNDRILDLKKVDLPSRETDLPRLNALIRPIHHSEEFRSFFYSEVTDVVLVFLDKQEHETQQQIHELATDYAIKRCQHDQFILGDNRIFEMTPEQKSVFIDLIPLVVEALTRFIGQPSIEEVKLNVSSEDKHLLFVRKHAEEFGLFHQKGPFDRELLITFGNPLLAQQRVPPMTSVNPNPYLPSPNLQQQSWEYAQVQQKNSSNPFLPQISPQQEVIQQMEYQSQQYYQSLYQQILSFQSLGAQQQPPQQNSNIQQYPNIQQQNSAIQSQYSSDY